MSLGFDPQRGQIFKITSIDKGARPWLYRLENERGKAYPFLQYRKSLRRAPDSLTDVVYPIEKIVAHRTVRRKKQVKVRYLFYGREFDEWRNEDSVLDPEN